MPLTLISIVQAALMLMTGMGWVKPLVELLFIIAALYIVYNWGFAKLQLAEPFRSLIMVVVGLVVLFILWQVLQPLLTGATG